MRRFATNATGDIQLRRGILLAGAAIRELPHPRQIAALVDILHDVADEALTDPAISGRFVGTALLDTESARRLGALGVVARASGLEVDARRDHPMDVLSDFGLQLGDILQVPTQGGGDVAARFLQRSQETHASTALLETLMPAVNLGHIAGWPTFDEYRTPGTAGCTGIGIVEGPRGTIVHRVEINQEFTITRAHHTDPACFNFPAQEIATLDAAPADLLLAQNSFSAPIT